MRQTVQQTRATLEHEALYPYIPVLVAMTHIPVASCIVQR